MIDSFLRTCLSLFTIKDFERILLKMGIRADFNECETYLDTYSDVFALKNGMYVTRAGVFTNQYFSFKPTRKEVDFGVFIAGDRCLPFIDPDVISSSLRFTCKDSTLSRKVIEYGSNDASELFSLYGEEFSSQYIAADPANKGLDIANDDFSLPPCINLTAYSLDPLIKYYGFKSGDRLLCRVIDWNEGIIEVVSVIHKQDSMQIQFDDMERQNWYMNLEKVLLKSFDLVGPCGSIEEQLALVFLDNTKLLCTPDCGSIEEFMLQTKRVNRETFGIETRLWRKGEDVPAVGKWNNNKNIDSKEVSESNCQNLIISDYLIDACIEDQLYEKKDNTTEVLTTLLPDELNITSRERNYLRLNINSRHDIIKTKYNWFADFEIGSIRHKALQLYLKVSSLVFRIDNASVNLALFPQQELIILSQIFSHISHILEILEFDSSAVDEEKQEILLSIEGMEFNYESICSEIGDVIDEYRKKGFEIIK